MTPQPGGGGSMHPQWNNANEAATARRAWCLGERWLQWHNVVSPDNTRASGGVGLVRLGVHVRGRAVNEAGGQGGGPIVLASINININIIACLLAYLILLLLRACLHT
jgi:hypothetical protein